MKKIVFISACLVVFALGKAWAQPDITILNGIEEIMNGDNTPSLVDNTDFGVFNLGAADDMEVFSIFDYGDGFKGATGSRFELVSRAQYEEETSEENVRDNYAYLWQEAVTSGHYKGSENDYIEELMQDVDSLVYDNSYSHLHDSIRELLGVTEEEYPIINCSGGGRMFDDKTTYPTVYREDLLQLIRDAETKKA